MSTILEYIQLYCLISVMLSGNLIIIWFCFAGPVDKISNKLIDKIFGYFGVEPATWPQCNCILHRVARYLERPINNLL